MIEDSMRPGVGADAAVRELSTEVRELRRTVEAAYRANRLRLAAGAASVLALLLTMLVGGFQTYSAAQATDRAVEQVAQRAEQSNMKFCALAGALGSGPKPTTVYGIELQQRSRELYVDLGCVPPLAP